MTRKKKETTKDRVQYLTAEQERKLKSDIPYTMIEMGIRGVVARANEIKGVVTMQSCEGHYNGTGERGRAKWVDISPAFVSIFCTKEIADWIHSGALQEYKIERYCVNSCFDFHFDIELVVDPAETRKLSKLFAGMKEKFGSYKEE